MSAASSGLVHVCLLLLIWHSLWWHTSGWHSSLSLVAIIDLLLGLDLGNKLERIDVVWIHDVILEKIIVKRKHASVL